MTQPGTPGTGAPSSGGDPSGQDGGPGPAGGAGGEGTQAPAWYGSAAPELQAWVKERSYASIDDLIMSDRGITKLKGAPANELLHLKNGWEENAETADPVYARMGRPEKPDGYELPAIPVGDGDYDLSPGFREKAHSLGLSTRQAKGLAEWFQGEGTGFQERRTAATAARIEREDAELSTEWGGANQENRVLATRAANLLSQSVGLDAAKLDSLFQSSFGYAPAMKMLALLGRSLGETPAVSGDPTAEGSFGQTPAAIGRTIGELEARQGDMLRAGKGMKDADYRALHNQITELYHKQTGESVPKGLLRS